MMKMLTTGVALATALTLSACAAAPETGEPRSVTERIEAGFAAVRTVVDEVRKTRCDAIPSADIEELRKCEEAEE
jgi:starvation-inducible outer membrane lipoprotein